MHWKTFTVVVTMISLSPFAAYAQCTKDTDCKGERICEAGSCINPAGTVQHAPKARRRAAKTNKVLLTVDANMIKGLESVGGKLIITNRNIIFSSHAFNFQRGEHRIKIKRIKKIEKFGLIPNGLRLRMKNGKKYEFRVSKRSRVIKTIRANM